ncbi:MAG: PorT family protein [Lewinellaceae bacterium]|nr:PorT family protein [Saprospiraceae bacterium]MCB9345593.1 PorT family protein [Lewinellaceae bacterium]
MKVQRIISLTLLAASLILSTKSQAQFSMNAGMTLGIDWASVSTGNEGDEALNIPGLYLSGQLDFDFTRQFGLQTRLAFVQKGYGFDFTKYNIDLKQKHRLNYLEIPVFLKYDFLPDPEAELEILAGPTFGFLLSEQYTVETSLGTPEPPPASETEKKDTGFALGLSIGKSTPSGKFSLDVMLQTSFSKSVTVGEGEKGSNQYFMVGLSYYYPLVVGKNQQSK